MPLFNEHGNYNHLPPEHPVQRLEDEIYRLVWDRIHALGASPLELHALAHHIMGAVSHAFTEQIVRVGHDRRRADLEVHYSGIDWAGMASLTLARSEGLPASGNRSIQMVKTIRECLSCSLRDAKDLWEMACDRGVFDSGDMTQFGRPARPAFTNTEVRLDGRALMDIFGNQPVNQPPPAPRPEEHGTEGSVPWNP